VVLLGRGLISIVVMDRPMPPSTIHVYYAQHPTRTLVVGLEFGQTALSSKLLWRNARRTIVRVCQPKKEANICHVVRKRRQVGSVAGAVRSTLVVSGRLNHACTAKKLP